MISDCTWPHETRRGGVLTVLSRGALVRLVGDGEVDSDLSSLKVHAADVVDTSLSVLDRRHRHESKASGSVRLESRREGSQPVHPVRSEMDCWIWLLTHSLIVHDDDLDYLTVL